MTTDSAWRRIVRPYSRVGPDRRENEGVPPPPRRAKWVRHRNGCCSDDQSRLDRETGRKWAVFDGSPDGDGRCWPPLKRYEDTAFFIHSRFIKNRRGFSCHPHALCDMGHWPNSGDLVHVESTVAHVGSSSIRMVHLTRMNSTKNTQLAELSQFGVQLDLDKRKPARLPSSILEKARTLLGG